MLAGWSRPVESARPLGGGMNSATALVDLVDERAVLKWVRDPVALAAGCDAAQRLARHGLRTGQPFPTTAGNLIHPAEDGAVALLRFVPGRELSPNDPDDQRDMALTLAAVHATEATPRSGTFLSDEIAELVHDVEPWVRPTVDLVLDEYARLPALTWSLLHADPESGAFLRHPDTGQVGLIDWTATRFGPVLYDVASALMYLGGRHQADAFWAAYLSRSPAPVTELTAHLDTFTRYRAAVQAAYFSMRIGTRDRTGIVDDGENWKGLRDAERMLRTNGAEMVTQTSPPRTHSGDPEGAEVRPG
ncbi:MAG: phosphotransferase [Propionibacteriaceae bacterium]